jgi:hypothetical protein
MSQEKPMANIDKRSPKSVPASGGGNSGTSNAPRVSPITKKIDKTPPAFKSTYGAGDGKGGPGVPAKDGGNRKTPALANKIGMPPNYDSYQSSGGK